MVSIRKSGAVLLAVVMLPVVVISSGDSSPARAVMAEVDRIDEEDPVRIAADIARQVAGGDLTNLTDLVVATSEHFSDAIVSAGLAGYLDACPRPGGASCRRTATVVTPADELAEVTAEVISDSGVPASRITLLGGPAAVSEAVRDRIASTAGWDGEGENPVRRVAGATRYDTAAAIAAHLVELAGESGGDPLEDSYRTVVVATGANPADALAASALAYGGGHVLLLSSGGEVPPALDAAVAALDANCAILVGGSTALSDAVEDHLERTVASTGRGACGAERIAGRDRHDTAARVADRVADQFGGPSSIVVTNPHGAGLAWTAAPLTRTRTSLLFTRDGELPEPTRDWITARPGIARVIVVGATRDIDRTVEAEVAESTFTRPLLPPPTPLAPAGLSLSYASTAFDTNQTSQILGPTVTGGTGPFGFALTSGALPPGVGFDASTGAFTGPSTWDLGFVTVSAGRWYSCGILTDTTVRCWGSGGNRQLGDGANTSSPHPVAVLASGTQASSPVTLSGVVQVSAGDSHTCAVLADGTARCWGSNTVGEIGNGSGTFEFLPNPVAVLESGTASNNPVTLSGVSQISVGLYHTCAVMADSTARCWGLNSKGQLGDGTTTLRPNPVTVLASGTAASSPVALSGVTQIVTRALDSASADQHTCALLIDGTVRCWGGNTKGQLGDGTTTRRLNPVTVLASGTAVSSPVPLTGVAQISAGHRYSCALLADATARCWGYGATGALGEGVGSQYENPVTVLESGTAVSSPVTLSGITQISGGWQHTCAVLSDATARCWGSGVNGKLGDGGAGTTANPVRVLASGTEAASPVVMSGVVTISPGWNHTCASLVDGGARCWGYSGHGETGDGTTSTTRNNPVRVLASGTEAASPVTLSGPIRVPPTSVTVTVTDSTAATADRTLTLVSR